MTPRSRVGGGVRVGSAVLLAALGWSTVELSAQSLEPRMVLGDGVACRTQPDTGAPAVRAHRPGDLVGVLGRSGTGPSDSTWFELAHRGDASCWLHGGLTANAGNRDAALLAVVEHALELGGDASFEHLVAVDNLVIERRRRSAHAGASAGLPPMLELRHLELLSRAGSRIGWDGEDPLRRAWLLGRSDLVTVLGTGGLYGVPNDRYWDLYERHRDSPAAEALAWAAAEAPVYVEECFAACILDTQVRPYQRYWSAFPDGPHLTGALGAGAMQVERASSYCVLILVEEEARADPDAVRVLLGQVRASLEGIGGPESDALREALDELEGLCLESGAEGLSDPAAVPVLIRALGNGFSLVPRALAAFGEQVVPVVAEVAAGPEDTGSPIGEVAGALLTLRFIVEEVGLDELAPRMRERMLEIAAKWLGESRPPISTLARAIDLAAVLDDPGLRQVLERLATDPEAIRARGATDVRSIERLRQRAADALSGVPPLPRP